MSSLLNGLVCYYKLDGNSNDEVASLNGTDTNITYSSGNGKIIQGAGFDGSTSKIVVDGILASLANSTAGTISFWANLTATGDERVLFGVSTASGSASELFIDARDSANKSMLIVVQKDGVIQWAADSPTNSITAWQGTWNHFCYVQTGASILLYVNGVFTALTGGGGAWFKAVITDATNKATKGRMGTLARGGTEIAFYSGKLDELGIWTRALNKNEIDLLYNGGAGLQYPFNNDNMFLMF